MSADRQRCYAGFGVGWHDRRAIAGPDMSALLHALARVPDRRREAITAGFAAPVVLVASVALVLGWPARDDGSNANAAAAVTSCSPRTCLHAAYAAEPNYTPPLPLNLSTRRLRR